MTMPSKPPLGLNNVCNNIKKASKPLIEKRRRARINSSLAELKGIVVTPDKTTQSATRPPKLEKADILEMTVVYVKDLLTKTQQDPSTKRGTYGTGFDFCLQKVYEFLDQEGCVDLKTRLVSYIHRVHSNNVEANAPTDDSMSCSSSSRSQTPTIGGLDNSHMEYSSCSPFTDTEQEVPSTSSSTSSNRTDLGVNCSHSMQRVMPEYASPNSCQDTMSGVINGPLNLAISPRRVQEDVVPRHLPENQVQQSLFPVVHYRTQNSFSPRVSTYNLVQHQKLERNRSPEGLDFACFNSCSCVWRPW